MDSLRRSPAAVGNDVPGTPDRSVRWLSRATLVFTVAVILGGAVVRATDSGAGCGESWPRCDGRLIPLSAEGATVIEFTHRLMSASLGLAMLALGVAIVRHRRRRQDQRWALGRIGTAVAIAIVALRYRMKTPLERSFGWAVAFFFGEVFIGAALVVFGWVEDDASLGRAIAVSMHLVNTFLLLGALTLVVHFASVPAREGGSRFVIDRAVLIGAAILLVIGASGALNALADTLYPADSLLQGFRDEFGVGAPLLLQIRIVHPFIAVLGAGVVFMLTRSPSFRTARLQRLRFAVMSVIGVQFAVGLLNVALLTPLETQVLHLLLADVLWIAWVMLGAHAAAPVHDTTHPVAAP